MGHTIPRGDLPDPLRERLAEGIEIVDLLVLSQLASSKAAARRLIEQGGAYLGGRRVDVPDLKIRRADLGAGGLLLRAGKKRYRRIVAAS